MIGTMTDPYVASLRRLRDAVEQATGPLGTDPPAALEGYVGKVRRHAYRVTDEDVALAKKAGLSEDGIFEATVNAAVSAGIARLERGLAAVEGAA
jgi:alkylhydroperoxidase family enzyme